MKEWREYKLGELYTFSSGLSKPREEFGFGYPFLTFKEIYSNRKVPDTLTELVNSTDQERIKCSIERGDVFLLRTSENVAELGMSCVALKNYENATFNGFTKRLRPHSKDAILPEFAVYLFYSWPVRQQITSFATLTTRSSLNNGMLEQISLLVPPLDEQRRIAAVLSTLDAKIDLLRRQNHTLEQIAQTLFTRWFVEFEFPVPFDKLREHSSAELVEAEHGQPYRASGGPMVDSELGEIPLGWRVGALGEIAIFKNGKTPPDRDDSKNIPVYGSNGIIGKADEYNVENAVIIGRVGSYCGSLYYYLSQCWVTDNAMFGKSALTDSQSFLYHFLRISNLNKRSTGSGQPLLNQSILNSIELAIPDKDLMILFEQITTTFYRKLAQNETQIQTLTRLRDTLLPKLMSGQLRVVA